MNSTHRWSTPRSSRRQVFTLTKSPSTRACTRSDRRTIAAGRSPPDARAVMVSLGTAKPADALRLAGCAHRHFQRWGYRGGLCPTEVAAEADGSSEYVSAHRVFLRDEANTGSCRRHRPLPAGESSVMPPPRLPRTPRSQQTLRVSPAALRAGADGGVCCIVGVRSLSARLSSRDPVHAASVRAPDGVCMVAPRMTEPALPVLNPRRSMALAPEDRALITTNTAKPAVASRLAGCAESQSQRWGLPASRLLAQRSCGTSGAAAAELQPSRTAAGHGKAPTRLSRRTPSDSLSGHVDAERRSQRRWRAVNARYHLTASLLEAGRVMSVVSLNVSLRR